MIGGRALLALLLWARELDCAPDKAINMFTVQMRVDLDLGEMIIPQLTETYFPGVYDTNVFMARRISDAFFVLNAVKYRGTMVYPGSEFLLNRNVIYYQPRPGAQFVHISSYYLNKTGWFESLEFYKTEEMEEFKENVKTLVKVDLADLSKCPLTLERRMGPNDQMEVFVSDIFKIHIKVGVISYGPLVIDDNVHFCYYRSFTWVMDSQGILHISILGFLSNGKRSEVRYTVDPSKEKREEAVKMIYKKVYYLTRLP